jgi:uncharacterized Zn finger protein (UPF0148 family)
MRPNINNQAMNSKDVDSKHHNNNARVKDIHIELKYCERCGVLWFRRVGDGEVYCVECAPEMQEIATSREFREFAGGVVCA